MTTTRVDPTVPSDAELISAVRAGDNAAYGELFERHRVAARRMALQLAPGPDADDLVSEAFIKVLDQLRAGSGPDVAFRAYLLTAIRRLHVDRYRAERRVQPSDDLEKYDPGVEFTDPSVAAFESSAAAKAFASLPERWQLVLWHLDVEGAKPADVAPMLGMTANGVSALAYRAREGLRQAYLQLHLADTGDEHCRWTTEHLGAYVRNGLGKRDSAKVREHLDQCPRCTAVYLELSEVNSGLRGLLAPLLLGAAGLGYVADAQAKVAVATGGAGLFTRARNWVTSSPANGVAAAGVTLGVIGAAIASTMLLASLLAPSSPTSDEAGSDGPSLTLPGPSDGASPGGPDATGPDATLPDGTTPDGTTPDGTTPNGTTPDGTGPDGSPDGVPGTGPGQPGTDDGPGADDPGSDNPGADNPGSDNPGTNNPGTNEPGTNNPGPNEPNPTEPNPTEPNPTEPEPTEPTEPTRNPPGSPAGLSITDGDDGIALTWDPVEDADGYQVYRSASTTGAAAGRSAMAAVSGELVSGPDLLTRTRFIDTDAPNGVRVLYEVVAVNDGGSSEAATLGPLRLPAVGSLSVRPFWSRATQCVQVASRGGVYRATLTADCGGAQRWRVWDSNRGAGWVTLRATSGPAAGLCLTTASTLLVSAVSLETCDGGTRQDWDLDPADVTAQQIASRARPAQVLEASIATLGGSLVTAPRIGLALLDDNQRFTFGLVDDEPAAQ